MRFFYSPSFGSFFEIEQEPVNKAGFTAEAGF